MQQLRNDYSLTFPLLSIARYSFIQLSRLRRREVKENAQTSKRYQRGFEPGLSRLRVRHSTTEPPRSMISNRSEGTVMLMAFGDIRNSAEDVTFDMNSAIIIISKARFPWSVFWRGFGADFVCACSAQSKRCF